MPTSCNSSSTTDRRSAAFLTRHVLLAVYRSVQDDQPVPAPAVQKHQHSGGGGGHAQHRPGVSPDILLHGTGDQPIQLLQPVDE